MRGPLTGLRVIEIAGIGPGPFCGMLLSDLGADVVRVDRVGDFLGGDPANPPGDILGRGRRSIAVDLKQPAGVEVVLRLVEGADALFESFRPGVAERLGIGPVECRARNPRLVYGRMTGWGQDGPYAPRAGHDINYVALAGALHPIGDPASPPTPPLNMLGDLGGGAMFLALGLLAGVLEARTSGQGQVVDAAMIDGVAALTAQVRTLLDAGMWQEERGSNYLDGGAHFYSSYETADGEYIAIGAAEPQFYADLLDALGLADDAELLSSQLDNGSWPGLKKRLADIFRTKTRAEWSRLLEGRDSCFAPVLKLSEAPGHPHNVARGSFVDVAGMVQQAPAPRFERTPGAVSRPAPHIGQHTDEVLAELGVSDTQRDQWRTAGVVAG